MCHVNFWCFSRHARPLPFLFFCGVQKNISKKKKKNSTTFLRPPKGSLKYLKYPATVYSPLIASIDVRNLHFLFGCVGCLHVLPSLHLKLNREVLRHWLASFGNISTGWIVCRLRPGSILRRYGCLHYMVMVGLFSCCFKAEFLKELGKILIEDE